MGDDHLLGKKKLATARSRREFGKKAKQKTKLKSQNNDCIAAPRQPMKPEQITECIERNRLNWRKFDKMPVEDIKWELEHGITRNAGINSIFITKTNKNRRQIDNYRIKIAKLMHLETKQPLGRSWFSAGPRPGPFTPEDEVTLGDDHLLGDALVAEPGAATARDTTLDPKVDSKHNSCMQLGSVSGEAGQPRSQDLRRRSTAFGPEEERKTGKTRNTQRGLRSWGKTVERNIKRSIKRNLGRRATREKKKEANGPWWAQEPEKRNGKEDKTKDEKRENNSGKNKTNRGEITLGK